MQHYTSIRKGSSFDYQDAARAFDPTGVAKKRGTPSGIVGIDLVLVNTLPTSMRYSRVNERNRITLRFDR